MMIAHSIIIFAIIDPSQTPRVTFIIYLMAHTYTYTYTVQIHIYTYIYIYCIITHTHMHIHIHMCIDTFWVRKRKKQSEERVSVCIISRLWICVCMHIRTHKGVRLLFSPSLLSQVVIYFRICPQRTWFSFLFSLFFCRRRFLFCISSPQPNSQKWSPTWRGGGNNSSLVR